MSPVVGSQWRAPPSQFCLPKTKSQQCLTTSAGRLWFGEISGAKLSTWDGTNVFNAENRISEGSSASASRQALAKEINDKLDQGYDLVDAATAESIATRLKVPRTTWSVPARRYRIYLAEQGTDYVGGMPPGFAKKNWPGECCVRPLQFKAILHAHPERLPLQQSAAIAIFGCHENCDPSSMQVLLLKKGDVDGPEPRHIGGIARLRQQHISYRIGDDTDATGETSRLFGIPHEINDVVTPPPCSFCGEAMLFVVQLGDDVGLEFGDKGLAYVFVCPHEHAAAAFWDCS